MSDPISKILDEANGQIDAYRRYLSACEPILRTLPPGLVQRASVRCDVTNTLQLSCLTCEEARQVMSALHAGKWTRCPSHFDTTMLDWESMINGVRVLLFASGPPGTCRIVEEEVEIPARKEIKRTLVCN